MGYLSSCKAHYSVSTSASLRKSAAGGEKDEGSNHASPSPAREILHFTHAELSAATSGFSDSALLGRGSHGSVFLASLASGALLAVKRPSRPHPSEALNEISVLSRIIPPSPCLVNLVGLTPDPPPLLVLEYMPNGSLFDLLHCSPSPPSWSLRLRLALQSARALLFLHSHRPPVLHRDVKSANVLLDGKHNARLADFGLAVFASPGAPSLRQTPPAGTLGYLDPAYVTPEKLSSKTDVFSFGILLLEIISGRKAIDVAHSPPSILDWALPLVRRGKVLPLFDPRVPPPRDPAARRQLAALAAACVRSSRDRRPSMSDVVDSLEVLRRTIPSRSWYVGNPCSAVDTAHRTTAARSDAREDDDASSGARVSPPSPAVASSRSVRNARRVFSEAGSRNLMDLMNAPNEEILRHRGSGTVVRRNSTGMRRPRTVRGTCDCSDRERQQPLRTRKNRSVRTAFEDLSILEEKDPARDGQRVRAPVPH